MADTPTVTIIGDKAVIQKLTTSVNTIGEYSVANYNAEIDAQVAAIRLRKDSERDTAISELEAKRILIATALN